MGWRVHRTCGICASFSVPVSRRFHRGFQVRCALLPRRISVICHHVSVTIRLEFLAPNILKMHFRRGGVVNRARGIFTCHTG